MQEHSTRATGHINRDIHILAIDYNKLPRATVQNHVLSCIFQYRPFIFYFPAFSIPAFSNDPLVFWLSRKTEKSAVKI